MQNLNQPESVTVTNRIDRELWTQFVEETGGGDQELANALKLWMSLVNPEEMIE